MSESPAEISADWRRGQLPSCEFCGHSWHGLRCSCDCPTAFVDPDGE